ncbi:MAG: hypothetical protein ACTSPM_00110 [Candidatus Heimdallarchaeota archaeon]
MKIVENKILNIIFQVAIAIGIAGIVMFLIQEIVTIWAGTAYTVILVIADFIGIIALITFIVWMFLPSNRDLTLNVAFISAAIYVLLYSIAHFFVVMYRNNNAVAPATGSILGDFTNSGVSLIGLVVLTLLSGLMIAIFALRFVKRGETPIYEKFAVLIWLLVLAIYDFGGFYYVKQSITYGTAVIPLPTLLGITFLPNVLELIFLLFAALLVIYKLFGKMDKKVEKILVLTLVNVFLLALAIATVNSLGFVFSDPTMIPSVIGNHFIMVSCFAVIITTFIMLIKEYPVRARQ